MSLRYKTRVLPKQAEVLGYQGGEAALRGAVRSGKTWALANWMHDRMERYPKARHIVIGADLPQLKAGALADFGVLLKTYGVEYDYRSTDGVYTLKHNGAQLVPVSPEIRQRVLGRSADTIWLEEPQTWGDGEQTYYSLHTRMSKSPEGMLHYPEMFPQLRMSFNPRQVFVGHWIWKLLHEQKAMPEYVFRTRDNFLMQYKGDPVDGDGIAGYVRSQQRTLPEHLWAVELDGDWATFGGAVYQYYMREMHSATVEGLPPLAIAMDRPLCWAVDFNVGIMASVIFQQHKQRMIATGTKPVDPHSWTASIERIMEPAVRGYQARLFYVLDEIAVENAVVTDVVNAFLHGSGNGDGYLEIAKKTGVILYGDPAGGNRGQQASSSSGPRTNWGLILEALDREGIQWDWQVASHAPEIVDRVNVFNVQMRNADGIGMLIDHGKCKKLIRDLQSVKWKTTPGGALRNELDKSDGSLTHWTDALGYGVHIEYLYAMGEKVALRDLPDYRTR